MFGRFIVVWSWLMTYFRSALQSLKIWVNREPLTRAVGVLAAL